MKDSSKKLVVVVRGGIVENVYCDKDTVLSAVDVIDLDSTEPDEVRRNKLRAKKAKKTMKQIY